MKISIKIQTIFVLIVVICALLIPSSCKSEKSHSPESPESFITPLGKVYKRNIPNGKPLDQYHEARTAYMQDSTNADLLIWYGRRTAYLGNYETAIDIYSKGIQKFPGDARLYRHRGHRYISIREYDKAIADLKQAAALIQGTENEIEPDGMPNAQNIPVSTLQGNIWYHLGLAYYLKHDYENAYKAYLNCRLSGSNPDNLVSSTHWLYMIQRRMGNKDKADSLLIAVEEDLNVIENTNYYELCKFYKGLISEEELIPDEGSSAASDALLYGLANWHLYNGRQEKGNGLLKNIVKGTSWTSFGYLAAESDLLKKGNLDLLLIK